MALAEVIMTALLEGRKTGYDLAKYFDVSLGYFWRASHQQIYSELKKLEKKGLLSAFKIPQQGKPDKIEYQLTEQGKTALDDWIQSSSTKPRLVKDELLVMLYNLDDSNELEIRQKILERKSQLQKSLNLYEKIRISNFSKPEELDKRNLGIYLVLIGGIEDARGSIAWCDQVMSHIS